MSNYNSLKATIDANIKQNGNQEITGQILNSVLNQMVNILGTGYQFAGVATIDTNPGTPDAKVFYVASEGIFPNFGGIKIGKGVIGFLKWDEEWSLDTISGIGGGSDILQVANVVEDGLFFVDSSLNIGAQLTQDGFSSFNSLNFRTL